MVSSHGAAAPEEIEQPVILDPPSGQVGSPACIAFNMDFSFGKKITQQDNIRHGQDEVQHLW